MIMTLYKGPIVDTLGYTKGGSHRRATSDSVKYEHWVSGILMLISCIVGWSAFFIVQYSDSTQWYGVKAKIRKPQLTYDAVKAQELPVVDIKTSANVVADNIVTAGNPMFHS
ncbi:unnamed protein product [Fraxinus pennsylvanica]|uniref:Uncharacterized protein n=1 Tax=Fraxinus pennsylvanica TaxID=56036 RepID=A0AAD1ZBI5_9LAMI|nr:unnamed protein product [Fraxinus pennsylvanica]